MTNEELSAIRSIFREEIGTVSTVLREEIGTVSTILREEIATVNTTLHQELGSLEQRINVRFDAVEHRLDGVEHRLDGVEHRLDGVEHRLDGVEHRLDLVEYQSKFMGEHLTLVVAGQRQLQKDFAKMQEDHQQIITVLDDVTTQIAQIKNSQITLETKFNDFQGISRREIQNLERRMTAHENMPVDRAHPRTFPPL